MDLATDDGPRRPRRSGGEGGIADLRYEVMYFLEAPDATIPAFKDVWAGIGDSIVVVGGDGLWNCHIHTDDIGAAVEAAIDGGRPRNIRVTDLLEQVEEERWVREAEPELAGPIEHHAGRRPRSWPWRRATGIRRIFHSLGVQGIVTGGQTMNPSTAQLLEAVEAAPADEVVILPEQQEHHPGGRAGRRRDRQDGARGADPGRGRGLRRRCWPTTPRPPAIDNAKAMAEAAASVVAGEVTRAVRDSTCDAGPDHRGRLPRASAARASRRSPVGSTEVCTQLLDLLVTDEHEIVTIIEGEGATAGDTRHIAAWLEDHRPDVDAEVHHGGQPLYPYLLRHRVAGPPVGARLAGTDRPAERSAPNRGQGRSPSSPSSPLTLDRARGATSAPEALAKLDLHTRARPADLLPPALPRPHQRARIDELDGGRGGHGAGHGRRR